MLNYVPTALSQNEIVPYMNFEGTWEFHARVAVDEVRKELDRVTMKGQVKAPWWIGKAPKPAHVATWYIRAHFQGHRLANLDDRKATYKHYKRCLEVAYVLTLEDYFTSIALTPVERRKEHKLWFRLLRAYDLDPYADDEVPP